MGGKGEVLTATSGSFTVYGEPAPLRTSAFGRPGARWHHPDGMNRYDDQPRGWSIAASAASGTPSSGSTPRWARTYSSTKPGPTMRTARTTMTITAPNVPDGAAAPETVTVSGSR